jgi:ABC-type cobalamin/Fe3+-siderophores transport system ATPase subunit
MEIDTTVQVINDLRDTFFRALDGLGEVASFQTLRSTCRPVDEATQSMEKVRGVRNLQQPCDGKVHCALIGNSSAGKTTLLRELFPDLDHRGWLRADVTDTTSQALAISSAQGLADTEAERVIVESWSLDQIKRLMDHKEVKEQNAKSQIDVQFGKEAVHVDGSRSQAPGAGGFRFPVRMSLVPFAQPYEPSPELANDERFRSALTTKQLSDQLVTVPVLHVGSQSYNSLQ